MANLLKITKFDDYTVKGKSITELSNMQETLFNLDHVIEVKTGECYPDLVDTFYATVVPIKGKEFYITKESYDRINSLAM